MSTEPFIGEVKIFGFNFAPRSYALCQGQLMSIAEYTALFSLIGTTYGGDGIQTFKLPDLQGRVPIGQGQGPGLPGHTIGEAAGSPTATMTSANMPAHMHGMHGVQVRLKVNGSIVDSNTPAGFYLGTNNSQQIYSETPGNNEFAAPAVVAGSTDPTGSGMAFSIVNPYLVMNYSIAIEGIFPSRN